MDHVLINRLNKVKSQVAVIFESFEKGRSSYWGTSLTRVVVYRLLFVFCGPLSSWSRYGLICTVGLEADELSEFKAGGNVFVDTNLDVLGELFRTSWSPQYFPNINHYFNSLLNHFLLHNLDNLVSLENLTECYGEIVE